MTIITGLPLLSGIFRLHYHLSPPLSGRKGIAERDIPPIDCYSKFPYCLLQAWKPPRAHHDSVSGRCVLKMDHYCVWVINTIGLLNYKAFMLFLFYTFLASFIGASTLVVAFVKALWKETAADLYDLSFPPSPPLHPLSNKRELCHRAQNQPM